MINKYIKSNNFKTTYIYIYRQIDTIFNKRTYIYKFVGKKSTKVTFFFLYNKQQHHQILKLFNNIYYFSQLLIKLVKKKKAKTQS